MSASLAQLSALAWRESRTARRRLLLYMSSISLGVAALVAIDSFAGNVTRSVTTQARTLLGGDVSFTSRQPFPGPIDTLIDSLATHGVPAARSVSFVSMASLRKPSGATAGGEPPMARASATRLVQIRGVSDNFPFYGDVTTEPAGRWRTLRDGANAVVDPSVLIALDAKIGDSLSIGHGRFRIIATLVNVPGDPSVQATFNPRVFIPARYVAETQLLVFGSMATYEVLFELPDATVPGKWVAPFRPRLEANRVRARTVTQAQSDLTDAVQRLSDFLGIIGLIALLLGGIGVASGVHAFVSRKIDTVAVLRCLGATGRQVLYIYLAQAAVMGLVGAAMGSLLGVGIQFALPHVVKDFLPVDVTTSLEPVALLTGGAIGLWVALIFALRPLIGLRNISPLQALRRDVDADALRMRWNDWPRVLVNVLLVASVVAFALSRGRGPRQAAAISLGVGVVMFVLWLSATVLSFLARRGLRTHWPYVIRQGVANLYRPANQTKTVILSLGFGAFLISTVYLVQSSLLGQLDVGITKSRGNLIMFDIQDDQTAGLDSIFRAAGAAEKVLQRAPIVTMRIAEINGTPADSLMKEERRPRWALRREYRSTFRDTLVASEKLVRGRWFKAKALAPGDTGEVSLDADLAKELKVGLNDIVTWNVQGVMVPTRITSLREVTWERFEPNFFAVLSPASVREAPKMWVYLANVPGAEAVARLQRAVVDRFPNISSIDLTLILDTVARVVSKVSVAIRFLALFSLAMGVPVLFSAVAATRRERIREGVLLKTLGATRRQIGRIMLAEYALLGALGSLTGMVLSFGGAWALMKWQFESPYHPAWVAAGAIALLMMAVTISIGMLTGRDVFRQTAMEALRQ